MATVLEELGLSAEADRVYQELLRRPGLMGAPLAQALGLLLEVTEHAAAELTAAGIITAMPEADLRVLSPRVAADLLIARQQGEIATRQAALERSRAAAGELLARVSNPDEYGEIDVERVFGTAAIRVRLEELGRETKREVATFVPGGAQKAADLAASRAPNLDMFERGVRSRTVYLSSVRNDADTLAHVAWLNEHGAEVRTAPALPSRMIVADGERAILPLGVANGERAVVILRGANAVAAMSALFEHVWASAVPLGELGPRDERGLSNEERAALRFLAEGLTDNAVARRLGTTERAARRLVDGVMSRLGARSRFEAGALAERRGWLS